ncbi:MULTISPECIES: ABC transporter ATP-binding protein [Lactococcus]|uniref:ABC transporter ATP-binding protein n=1 Tax=Lactococcus TaxID=1357 RepID=UPI001CDB5B32|nr:MULTISPECIES: ABC transporter ATP-binding protein [Lactococcus]MCA2390116.1 ABC transporter ATP-binding protein/permease [Lactococcus sp. NH2-7C]MCT1194961.1 ABC transporter ATP-binding protein [Lactococcus lactis]WGV29596.1 ABC transporter ATP-binding protein [Lactococcus sp. NH2-7C]
MLTIGRRYLNFWPVFWALFLLVIQVVTNLWLPTITADIINKGISQSDMKYIWFMGLIMLFVSLTSWLSAIGNVYFASKQSQGLGLKLRRDLFNKVLFMDERNFQEFGDATLITRTTNDVTQLQNVFQTMLRMMLMAPMMLVGSIFMAWKLSHDLLLVFLIALPILTLAVVINISISMPRFRSMQTKVDKINLIFQQGLTGVRVIRAFRRDQYEIDKFDEANRDLTHTSQVVLTTIAMLMPIMTVILSFTNIGIVWFGAHLISKNMMEMGSLVAFLTYATQILMSFMQLSAVAVMLPRAQVSAVRVREVLDTKDKITDENSSISVNVSISSDGTTNVSVSNSLALNHVSFKFDEAKRQALSDLSVNVAAGQTLAIIGGTGSGKSTILNLIARLIDPTNGSVTIDGTDIRQISQYDLHEKVSFTQQKAQLFSGTVRSNLQFGKSDATDEEMWQVLEIAQAADFVREQGGLDMAVEQNGANFSGGQKQRLSIARTLIKEAEIYLFDDSFSALDFATDRQLRTAINHSAKHKNKIKVIVAQRIATVMSADQILVLENGIAVGLGTHESLAKSCPQYQETMQSQLSDDDLVKMGVSIAHLNVRGGDDQ